MDMIKHWQAGIYQFIQDAKKQISGVLEIFSLRQRVILAIGIKFFQHLTSEFLSYYFSYLENQIPNPDSKSAIQKIEGKKSQANKRQGGKFTGKNHLVKNILDQKKDRQINSRLSRGNKNGQEKF